MSKLTARLRRCGPIVGASALVAAISYAAVKPAPTALSHPSTADGDSINIDTTQATVVDSLKYRELTMADYQEVAVELGISVAAIRAVVSIEAGAAAEGFTPDDKPIINFDLTMFRQAARKRGVNIDKYRSEYPVVFNRPNTQKYGSYQAAQYARLKAALNIDSVAAYEGCFWGMFQIGGFNWKPMGYGSVEEFVAIVSKSERSQLEMFAHFLVTFNMVKYLQKRDWANFARRYNGPGYKKRGYDRRMAAAYAKFSK